MKGDRDGEEERRRATKPTSVGGGVMPSKAVTKAAVGAWQYDVRDCDTEDLSVDLCDAVESYSGTLLSCLPRQSFRRR